MVAASNKPNDVDHVASSLEQLGISTKSSSVVEMADQLRLECLVRDMVRFKEDPAAQSRVELVSILPFCLGPPYFTQEKAESLLDTVGNSDGVSLRKYLGEIVEGKGYFLCTAHTLAPAIIEFFKLPKDFEEEGKFKRYYPKFCAAVARAGEGEYVADADVYMDTVSQKNTQPEGSHKKSQASAKAEKKGKKESPQIIGFQSFVCSEMYNPIPMRLHWMSS